MNIICAIHLPAPPPPRLSCQFKGPEKTPGIQPVGSIAPRVTRQTAPAGPGSCEKVHLDSEPTIWLNHWVKAIGIFEAKTHLTAICSEVARTGQPVLVQRRGRPLVLISVPPVEWANPLPDIHTAWVAWENQHGSAEGNEADFPEVWQMRQDQPRNPLAEEG